MAETLPELQSVVKLVAVASAYPARAISPEFHQSHPVPVGGPKGLRMAFLYCKGMIRNPGEGLHLMPPEYMAYINATTAIFEELKAVMPGDFGQPHQVGEFLGTYLTIPERALPEFLTRQTRLYQAYDQLLPSYAGGQGAVAPEVTTAAAQFRALFPEVSERPLLPYYLALAGPFFAWVDRVAPPPASAR